MRRLSGSIAALLIFVACALAGVSALAQTPPELQRIPFQIATGPLSGSYFSLGEVLARIVSNPPGAARCADAVDVCGPVGLIGSARTSPGSVENIAALRSGRVNSALVQGDIAAMAFAGDGPFKTEGPFKDMRVLATLQRETVHLLAAPRARIKRLADLKGKRVAVGEANSALTVTARGILQAAGLGGARVRLYYLSPDQAAAQMKDGKLDAMFIVSAAPSSIADDLIRRGSARLVPIEGRAIAQWLRKQPMLKPAQLAEGAYRGSKAINTLSVATLWVALASTPDNIAYALARAIWSPANRREIQALGPAAASMQRDASLAASPVPLHQGAARFYQEGRLQN